MKSFYPVPKGQKILLGLVITCLITLGGSTIFVSESTLNQANFLASVESPGKSIWITQRETLKYAIYLNQWSAGIKDRREVQIARALLSQRLSVLAANSESISGFSSPEYLASLYESDALLASHGPGYLPTQSVQGVQAKIKKITNNILLQSRIGVDKFNQQQDRKIREVAAWRNKLQQSIFALFFLFLAIFMAFVYWNSRTMRSGFRKEQVLIEIAKKNVDQMLVDLTLSENVIKV